MRNVCPDVRSNSPARSLNTDCIAAADSRCTSAALAGAPNKVIAIADDSAIPACNGTVTGIRLRPMLQATVFANMDTSMPPDLDLRGERHSPTPLVRLADKVQCLGDMPWKTGRLRSSPILWTIMRDGQKVKLCTNRFSGKLPP